MRICQSSVVRCQLEENKDAPVRRSFRTPPEAIAIKYKNERTIVSLLGDILYTNFFAFAPICRG